MMNREPISCRAVNALTARLEAFAARKARVFKRAVFNLAAYIDNNSGLFTCMRCIVDRSSHLSDLVWHVR